MTLRLLLIALLCSLAGMGQARDFLVLPKAQVSSPKAADGSIEAPFATVWDALRSGRVTGGDRILLGDGSHGRIKVVNATFDPPIEITAQNPGQAHAEQIIVQGGKGVHFRDLSVWPSQAGREAGEKPGNLLSTDKKAVDIRFEQMDIRGHPDAPEAYMGWSKDDWLALRANGARLEGPNNRLVRSTITGVLFGITTTGDDTVVAGNWIKGFGGDAMRGLGDGSVFMGNRAENCVKISDNHDDGFQSWATKRDADGRKTVSGLVIENNIILEWTGPQDHPLRCKLQGIGLFDGIYRNFSIRNNLIAISAYHGIALYAGADSRIVNNTVVHISGGRADFPWILLRDNRNGWESGETLVNNNVAMSYKGIKNALRGNSVPTLPAQVFMAPDRLDFRLRPDGALVDAGSADGAPEKDISGALRKGRPDLGAFEAR